MSRFIQLHLLTSYPPANLNRDDLGRPKTAMMGNVPRLRVSSQSLKRAWRTSDDFKKSLDGHVGVRTKEMGIKIYKDLTGLGVKHSKALQWARSIAGEFGKLKKLTDKEKKALAEQDEDVKKELVELEIEQLTHFSPQEIDAIEALVAVLGERNSAPEADELKLLRKHHSAADIALFGRMLASKPEFKTEAAAQVAHAISVHKITLEDDFFTAVDDLNNGDEDMGAGHMGETEFAAGLFYLYICIDQESLIENLSGDAALAAKTIAALIQSAARVAPTGKQNSFASRARASYILCEKGDQQPRSLSVAFLKPVEGIDLLQTSISRLNETLENMDKTYGACADHRSVMNASSGEGSLQAIIDCAQQDLSA